MTRTLVKVCGLTNETDALAAAEAGADCLGFVLVPGTPRFVTPETLAEFAPRLPSGVRLIGVFRDADESWMLDAARRCRLDVIQLHGGETTATAARLAAAGLTVWKAIALTDAASLERARAFAPHVSAILADAEKGGRPCRHDLAAKLSRETTLLLAGGLTPANVAAAIAAARPAGVDVAGGVEATPGHKNHSLIRSFIEQVRAADTQQHKETQP